MVSSCSVQMFVFSSEDMQYSLRSSRAEMDGREHRGQGKREPSVGRTSGRMIPGICLVGSVETDTRFLEKDARGCGTRALRLNALTSDGNLDGWSMNGRRRILRGINALSCVAVNPCTVVGDYN